MDKYLRPERLDADPSSSSAPEEWAHWKRTFINFLESFAEPPDKLKAITNFVSPRVYRLIEDCITYDGAMAALEAVFVKQRNEIFARYVLSTRRQLHHESIDQYIQALHALSKDCKFTAVTAEQYRDEYVRDSFISGIISNNIQKRLLENKTLDLATALCQARTLDLAQKDADYYSHSAAVDGSTAALSSSERQNSKDEASSNTTALATRFFGASQSCFFCGGVRHSRSVCPARDAACNKCGKKGHYSRVCKSAPKRSAAADSTPQPSAPMDAAWTSAITAATAASRPTLEVEINGITLAALVDSGSTNSFIREDLVKQLGLKVRPSKVHVYMASSALSATTTGFCVATIRIGKSSYSGVRLSILSNLCAEVILGQKFMNLHSEIIFIGSGDRPALKVCGVAEAALNPPTLFGECLPIASL